jgi:FixJ family two-component response regulator
MSSPAPIRVALVEDDASVQQAMRRLLTAHGMEVAVYDSAEAFLRGGLRVEPDCLVLDIQLNGMTGLDLQVELARLRPGLPIVFLTAHHEETFRALARQLGCSAYLSKIVPAATIVEAIHQAVKEGAARR